MLDVPEQKRARKGAVRPGTTISPGVPGTASVAGYGSSCRPPHRHRERVTPRQADIADYESMFYVPLTTVKASVEVPSAGTDPLNQGWADHGSLNPGSPAAPVRECPGPRDHGPELLSQAAAASRPGWISAPSRAAAVRSAAACCLRLGREVVAAEKADGDVAEQHRPERKAGARLARGVGGDDSQVPGHGGIQIDIAREVDLNDPVHAVGGPGPDRPSWVRLIEGNPMGHGRRGNCPGRAGAHGANDRALRPSGQVARPATRRRRGHRGRARSGRSPARRRRLPGAR